MTHALFRNAENETSYLNLGLKLDLPLNIIGKSRSVKILRRNDGESLGIYIDGILVLFINEISEFHGIQVIEDRPGDFPDKLPNTQYKKP